MIEYRKNESPLEQSISMIKEALDLAYYYQNDPTLMPSREDLAQFVRLSETLFFYLSAANQLVRRVHERAGVQVPILNRPPFNH
jgi:hypothetical protein